MTPHYVIKWNSLRSLHFHQYLSYHRHGFNGIHGLPFFILGSHPPPPSLSLPHHHPFSTQSTLSPNPSSSSSSSSTVTTTPTSTHPFPSLATTSIVTFSESEVHSFSTKDVTSYLRSHPFEESINQLLLAPIQVEDIEVKPDGLLYLPEIKYRRILNQAFKPGGIMLHFFFLNI
ncbi:hypothetical protein HMI54_003477 [Coelomomyces lativittatus]|nr:hypothetical protein HMI54_003477 [Coelomomyces lativittatus]